MSVRGRSLKLVLLFQPPVADGRRPRPAGRVRKADGERDQPHHRSNGAGRNTGQPRPLQWEWRQIHSPLTI